MSAVAAALVLAAEKTPAQEGKEVVIVMLIVGLIFVGVIVLGQTARWLSTRRGHRH